MKQKDLPKKIAVLMGGPGSERDVSLATGRGVSKALRSLGADIVDVDVRDENFLLPEDVDLAFITIHGTFGEDEQLQKILEDRRVDDSNNKCPFPNPQAGGSAEHVCPAKIDAGKEKKVQELALQAFRALGLVVYGRVDVLLSGTGDPFVLEVNTIPGMTETSLLPEAAAAAGINYIALSLRIIELSRARRARAGPRTGTNRPMLASSETPAY